MKSNKMRVPHGDEYCYIDNDMTINYRLDYRGDFDNKQYKSGNYFNDEKDAKAALEKFKAILNGADIMEDYQREKIDTWDIMLETKDEISKNYSKLLNNQKVKAVLKGADVIEMPDTDYVENEIHKIVNEITQGYDRVYVADGEGNIHGNTTYEELTDYLKLIADLFKTKIVC